MIGILNKAITGIFGSKSERDLKELNPILTKILEAEKNISKLRHNELRGMTADFKKRINDYVKDIENEITELEQKAENNPDLDLHEKEDIYRRIDQLKKDRNAKTEEILNEILPE